MILHYLKNASIQVESRLHSIEQEAAGIGLYMIPNKTDSMRFKQERTISTFRTIFDSL